MSVVIILSDSYWLPLLSSCLSY